MTKAVHICLSGFRRKTNATYYAHLARFKETCGIISRCLCSSHYDAKTDSQCSRGDGGCGGESNVEMRSIMILFPTLFIIKMDLFFFNISDSSSTNTTENPSPSLSPPPSASKTSPLHHSGSSSFHHLNTSNESDDDGQDCMDDDDDQDGQDRPSDGGSPGLNGSMQSKRKKKTRTVFSRAQVFQLESTFDCKR